jgi:hypothetical protein
MGEAGAGLKGTQGMQGQLTSSKGPGRMGNSRHVKGITFPSKLFNFSKYSPAWFCVCSE